MTGPTYVDWAITRSCNLRCRHCVGMESGELTHDEAVNVARDVIALAPKWVILEGGEPLLRPDLPEIGTMFRQAGIDVFVITNGNAFTEKRLRELASFRPRVLFSIDAADAETYEYIKPGGSLVTAEHWAARCAWLGIFHGTTAVLTRLTRHQARDIIRLTERLGGRTTVFLPLKPFGDGRVANPYYVQHALSPQEQEETVNDVFGARTDLDVFYDEPFIWNLAAAHGFLVGDSASGITVPEIRGCAAAHSLYIQTDGSVRPCMFCPASLTFGNAARESLSAVWTRMRASRVMSDWAERKSRQGACAECPGFDSCRGCLARTTILLGSPTASDPCCPMTPRASVAS